MTQNEDYATDGSNGSGGDGRERLATIARLLNHGKTLEALFIANAATWGATGDDNDEARKANFNAAEPRLHGEWRRDGSGDRTWISVTDDRLL